MAQLTRSPDFISSNSKAEVLSEVASVNNNETKTRASLQPLRSRIPIQDIILRERRRII